LAYDFVITIPEETLGAAVPARDASFWVEREDRVFDGAIKYEGETLIRGLPPSSASTVKLKLQGTILRLQFRMRAVRLETSLYVHPCGNHLCGGAAEVLNVRGGSSI
jgi:hypothetical protein